MRRYLPTPSDHIDLVLARNWIESKLRQAGITVFHRVGSSARGTAIRKNRQLDYFLECSADHTQFLEKIPSVKLCHRTGGFPYYHLKTSLNGKCYKFDLVPIGTAPAVAQRTIRHQLFMERVLSEELRKEIIRAKHILKRLGLYDANEIVRGFSGWAVEVMIWKYGSLELVPAGTTLISCPLEPERNVLGSVSMRNLRRFYRLQSTNFKKVASYYLPDNLYVYRGKQKIYNLPWVRHYVRFKDRIILELQDFISGPVPEHVSLPSSYFLPKEGIEILNTDRGHLKVHSFKTYCQRYQLTRVAPGDRRNIREYNFFR